ncbi:MAG: TonB-dependent receptor, partial [Alphaproteobacteria bacterium]|nr:TonB-dependent receptor [Alphaproteobacteria bacterium]
DFGDGLSLRDQVRYGHYTRQFRITEPQLYTTASETMPGATGSPLLIVPGTPLASLQVARNELYGTSLETFLQNQTDLTAKFRTGFVEHDAMAGVEIGRETSDPVRYTTIGPYSLTPLLDPNPNQAPNVSTYLASRTNTIANTAALYLLDTLKLNEQWQIMGGVRLDRFDAAFNQTVYNNPVTGAGAGYTALSHLDQAASWRGAVIYKPLPNGTVYFDAGTSFNPSAEALSLTVATASLAPERNKTYEVGSKWELLDNQLAVTGAIYQTEQTNLREVDPNNPLFDILAGDAVAKGIELESAGHLTPEWQVTGGFAYTFSEIDKSPITGPASDLGHRLGNVPMYSANLWTTYQLPWWHLQIGGGVDYASSRFASTTPTIAGGVDFWKEVPGYWTLNGMLKYPLGEKVALQLNLYNLADNKYYDQVHPSHVVPGAGTTALFTLSYKE